MTAAHVTIPDHLKARLTHDVAQTGIDLYQGLDLFVLPSHREGLPRTLVEASAMELPIVATQIRGCREVVVPGETGLLVNTIGRIAVRETST